MAKRLVLALVLAAAALFAYNYITTGKLTLIPSSSLSAQEKELSDLEARLKAAVRQYAQAGRAAGMSGVDTTSDAEAARVEIQAIQKRLDDLGRQGSAEVKEKLAKVKQELEEAKQGMGIR
jgi:DNA invertase Pin-like site-specific DNA recombinase